MPKYLNGKEALAHVRKIWDLPKYKEGAFRGHLFRLRQKGIVIDPDLATGNSSFWLEETLNKIPKPDRSAPRGPRNKKDGDEEASGETGRVGKVMCNEMSMVA